MSETPNSNQQRPAPSHNPSGLTIANNTLRLLYALTIVWGVVFAWNKLDGCRNKLTKVEIWDPSVDNRWLDSTIIDAGMILPGDENGNIHIKDIAVPSYTATINTPVDRTILGVKVKGGYTTDIPIDLTLDYGFKARDVDGNEVKVYIDWDHLMVDYGVLPSFDTLRVRLNRNTMSDREIDDNDNYDSDGFLDRLQKSTVWIPDEVKQNIVRELDAQKGKAYGKFQHDIAKNPESFCKAVGEKMLTQAQLAQSTMQSALDKKFQWKRVEKVKFGFHIGNDVYYVSYRSDQEFEIQKVTGKPKLLGELSPKNHTPKHTSIKPSQYSKPSYRNPQHHRRG
jgi:hypothetical protein